MARPAKAVDPGIAHGFRSGLEDKIAEQLKTLGVPVVYEEYAIKYTVPEKEHRYTPDFVAEDLGIVIETKGIFDSADRQKHRLIKGQHPDLDIRFVFSNAKARLNKTSLTTYSMWCEKNGFQWADKRVPEAWLHEPPNEKSRAAIAGLHRKGSAK